MSQRTPSISSLGRKKTTTMSEVANPRDPLASTRHLVTCSAARESSLDIAMSSPSPSLPEVPPTIEALLEDARHRFMHLSCATPADNGAEDSPIEVVVTRGVTREVFDAMDDDLLHGLVVELRDDGTLVLIEVLTNEYSEAKFEIATTAKNYVDANMAQDLVAQKDWQDGANGGGPNNRRPSVAVLEETSGGWVPLVIFIVQVEGQSGSFRDMVRKASFYFANIPHLERVVGVQFFRRHEGLATLLEVPALAVAFERGAQFAVDQRVRILMARSFGNYPLHGNATNTLEDPPPNVPLEPYADVARLRAEWFPCVLHMNNVLRDLRALERAHALRTLVVFPAPMVVPMPPGYPDLVISLFKVFIAAMQGWFLDR